MADQLATDGFLFDAEAGGDHEPSLYDADSVADRLTIQQALTPDARSHYRRHGWLAVRNLLTPAELHAAAAATDDLAHGRVSGFKGIVYESAVRPRLPTMSPGERADAVRKLFRFAAHEPRMEALVHHPTLLAILRHLLDQPALRMFQDMALLKPPRIGREKPWHQDHAFFDFPLDTRFAGVWIALDPATLENGCMHVLDGGHHHGPRTHWKRRDFQICDADILGRRSVAFPLEPGDAMIFDGLLPHGTPANTSPDRRRALQFHYCPAAATELETDVRLRTFGAEGKDATC